MSHNKINFQIIIVSSIVLNKMLLKFNIDLLNQYNFIYDDTRIIMLKTGNYIFNLNCLFDQHVKIGLLINDNLIHEKDSENNLINFHEIINTKTFDIITIQNLLDYDIKIIDNINFPNNNVIELIKIN